jgi:hypothetical protein
MNRGVAMVNWGVAITSFINLSFNLQMAKPALYGPIQQKNMPGM